MPIWGFVFIIYVISNLIKKPTNNNELRKLYKNKARSELRGDNSQMNSAFSISKKGCFYRIFNVVVPRYEDHRKPVKELKIAALSAAYFVKNAINADTEDNKKVCAEFQRIKELLHPNEYATFEGFFRLSMVEINKLEAEMQPHIFLGMAIYPSATHHHALLLGNWYACAIHEWEINNLASFDLTPIEQTEQSINDAYDLIYDHMLKNTKGLGVYTAFEKDFDECVRHSHTLLCFDEEIKPKPLLKERCINILKHLASLFHKIKKWSDNF